MLDTAPILPKAIKYAVTAHEQTLHRYDGAPYSVHLAMAAHYADMFSYLLPEEKRDYVLSAVWLHDTIEDCRITYNDLKKVFGAEIAEMVFAVTNNRGRTRDERADEGYYRGIRNTPYATFIKLCDRLANVEYSAVFGEERMMDVYRSEAPHFFSAIKSDLPEADYTPMVKALKKFL